MVANLASIFGLIFLFIYQANALVTGEKIKVMASHVGPVNNPSEVSFLYYNPYSLTIMIYMSNMEGTRIRNHSFFSFLF